MAPTTTTGTATLTARFRKYAVSSSVAVPCVTTMPAIEGSPATEYARVWTADQAEQAGQAGQAGQAVAATSPARGPVPGGVEPVSAVLDRAVALIGELERLHSGRDILLVSHGDTLAILQAGFLGMEPSRHRSVPPFGTAEIRPLRRA